MAEAELEARLEERLALEMHPLESCILFLALNWRKGRHRQLDQARRHFAPDSADSGGSMYLDSAEAIRDDDS